MRESRLPTPTDLVRWVTVFALTLVGGGDAASATASTRPGNDAVFTQGLVEPRRPVRRHLLPERHHAEGSARRRRARPRAPRRRVRRPLVRDLDPDRDRARALIAAAAARTAMHHRRRAASSRSRSPSRVYVHFTLSDAAVRGTALQPQHPRRRCSRSRGCSRSTTAPWRDAAHPAAGLRSRPARCSGSRVQTILPVVRRRVGDRHRRARARRAARRRRRPRAASSGGSRRSRRVRRVRRPRRSGTCCAAASPSSGRAGGRTRATRARASGSASARRSRGAGTTRTSTTSTGRCCSCMLARVRRASRSRRGRGSTARSRVTHVALLGWLAGGWFQLVTGERYSTHYFVGDRRAHRDDRAPRSPATRATAVAAWPRLVAAPRSRGRCSRVLLSLLPVGGHDASGSMSAASITSGFTSAQRGAELTRENQPGPNRSVQAVLDLVSRDRDPLLLYDDNQFLYPDYRRIPATRFQQRYFLVGSIYLGQTSPKYILHDTWKWFDEDLRQSNPAAFLETGADRLEAVRRLRATTHFEPAFDGEAGTVQLRNDVAESVLHGAATARGRRRPNPRSARSATRRRPTSPRGSASSSVIASCSRPRPASASTGRYTTAATAHPTSCSTSRIAGTLAEAEKFAWWDGTNVTTEDSIGSGLNNSYGHTRPRTSEVLARRRTRLGRTRDRRSDRRRGPVPIISRSHSSPRPRSSYTTCASARRRSAAVADAASSISSSSDRSDERAVPPFLGLRFRGGLFGGRGS